MERQIITIKCEQDAWNTLEKYYEDPPENALLNIEDFEPFQYYICGNKYHGTLNVEMMNSIIALQQAIYRLHAYFEFGIPDVRKLTKKDKEKLEIVISVEKGSSDIKAQIVKIVQSLVNRMEGKHVVILGCVALVAYFGTKPIIHYLDNKKEERWINIINILASKIPEIQYIKDDSDLLKDKIIKNSVNFTEGIQYNRHQITNDEVKEKAKQTREKALPVRLDGDYKIIGLDYEEDYTRFELEVINVPELEVGYKFYAYLYNDIFKKDDIVFKAHKEDKTYILKINGNMIKKVVNEATIYDITYKK